jgi:hypothetical protein
MNKFGFMLLFFGCLGICTEIFFVAFMNLINNEPFCNEPLWSLTGKTYVWMFPIYALIPILGGLLFRYFRPYPLLLRLLGYTLLIFTVESIAGFLLDQLTGKCPWEYTKGWHIMGYIQLEYTPA